MKILLVDDDESLRSIIAGLLGTEGHVVHEAGSGLEAVRMLHRQHFDLVISDQDMPGSHKGLDVLRFSWDNHPKQERILFTGNEDPLLCRQASLIRAKLVQKPTNLNELKEFIRRFSTRRPEPVGI